MPLDTRITLHKLEVFDLVVRLGSVTGAADRLSVSQPVVTAHLRSLEQRVGARLFERDGRRLRLTESGDAVHAWAAGVLGHTRDLARQLDGLADGTGGSAIVGASMSIGSYLLPPVVARFRAARPDAHLELAIGDTAQAMRDAAAGHSDFAVVPSEHLSGLPDLAAERIGTEEMAIVAAPGEWPPGPDVGVDELEALPFAESPSGSIRRAIVDGLLEHAGVRRRRIVLELGHPEALKRAVEEGSCLALLFRSAVEDELAAGRLRELVLAGRALEVPLFLVHRRGRLFSALQRDLMDAIRAAVGP